MNSVPLTICLRPCAPIFLFLHFLTVLKDLLSGNKANAPLATLPTPPTYAHDRTPFNAANPETWAIASQGAWRKA